MANFAYDIASRIKSDFLDLRPCFADDQSDDLVEAEVEDGGWPVDFATNADDYGRTGVSLFVDGNEQHYEIVVRRVAKP